MAFALASKSESDFPHNGNIFLKFTLIITLFTMIYASLFLDFTLVKCNILIESESDIKESPSVNNLFEILKTISVRIHNKLMLPLVTRYIYMENLNQSSATPKQRLIQDL